PEYAAIDVDAAQDGYLVLTDAYYPGWTATIDGQPTNIERADVMFRAVKVPAGPHRVELRYEPQSFRIGMWVTIGAWAILIAAWAVVLRGRTIAK
ncbi:MAG TPA: YfhO family protein, partial [Anaerolineae bacterium]